TKVSQISHWNKPIVEPRLSPDGRTIAFSSLVDNSLQVFVMLSSGAEPLQLTSDEGDKVTAAFSADGSQIFYTRVLGREETWSVPTLGGTPTRVTLGINVQPSADGNSLYYLKSQNQNALFQSTKSGIDEKMLYTFSRPITFPFRFFPFSDNQRILIRNYVPG